MKEQSARQRKSFVLLSKCFCICKSFVGLKEIEIQSLTMNRLCCITIPSSILGKYSRSKSFTQEAVLIFSGGRFCHSCCDQNNKFPIFSSIRVFLSMTSFSKVTVKASLPHDCLTAVQGIKGINLRTLILMSLHSTGQITCQPNLAG